MVRAFPINQKFGFGVIKIYGVGNIPSNITNSVCGLHKQSRAFLFQTGSFTFKLMISKSLCNMQVVLCAELHTVLPDNG